MKITPESPPEDGPAGEPFAGSAFSRYSGELHRYLLRRVGRLEDADDLAQEVFLRLLRVDRPDRLRKPIAYLFSVAAHLIREFKLSTARDHEHVTFDSEAVEHAAETQASGPIDDSAYRLELKQQLINGFKRLPQTHRTVLLLVKRDGLSHEEAAEAMGLTVHTVERYVSQGVARMAQMRWDR